ncbi:DnaJ family domain-containing protein [Chitinilyticum piscinae]|uniref:DUF1992 domain-containing protein n=1 Tax=Chitinilyticum piscinae TaxID=2866724 RepID=A0A8J7G082_9NEIS|nr:DUF1992 domain-containing protein [Chitinilyticum piscinae]MBE9609575.1 DUF1992 domain-containing protein [Chitinilyticum piscinae]
MSFGLLLELAERRIEAARDAGEFDNLPGMGQPLPQEAIDPLLPEHQRIAYRPLKNAGYIPPEIEQHREAVEISLQLVTACADCRPALLARLARINLFLLQQGHAALRVEYYGSQLAQRFAQPTSAGAIS